MLNLGTEGSPDRAAQWEVGKENQGHQCDCRSRIEEVQLLLGEGGGGGALFKLQKRAESEGIPQQGPGPSPSRPRLCEGGWNMYHSLQRIWNLSMRHCMATETDKA